MQTFKSQVDALNKSGRHELAIRLMIIFSDACGELRRNIMLIQMNGEPIAEKLHGASNEEKANIAMQVGKLQVPSTMPIPTREGAVGMMVHVKDISLFPNCVVMSLLGGVTALNSARESGQLKALNAPYVVVVEHAEAQAFETFSRLCDVLPEVFPWVELMVKLEGAKPEPSTPPPAPGPPAPIRTSFQALADALNEHGKPEVAKRLVTVFDNACGELHRNGSMISVDDEPIAKKLEGANDADKSILTMRVGTEFVQYTSPLRADTGKIRMQVQVSDISFFPNCVIMGMLKGAIPALIDARESGATKTQPAQCVVVVQRATHRTYQAFCDLCHLLTEVLPWLELVMELKETIYESPMPAETPIQALVVLMYERGKPEMAKRLTTIFYNACGELRRNSSMISVDGEPIAKRMEGTGDSEKEVLAMSVGRKYVQIESPHQAETGEIGMRVHVSDISLFPNCMVMFMLNEVVLTLMNARRNDTNETQRSRCDFVVQRATEREYRAFCDLCHMLAEIFPWIEVVMELSEALSEPSAPPPAPIPPEPSPKPAPAPAPVPVPKSKPSRGISFRLVGGLLLLWPVCILLGDTVFPGLRRFMATVELLMPYLLGPAILIGLVFWFLAGILRRYR